MNCTDCFYCDKYAQTKPHEYLPSQFWKCDKNCSINDVTGKQEKQFCNITKMLKGDNCGYANERERTAEINQRHYTERLS